MVNEMQLCNTGVTAMVTHGRNVVTYDQFLWRASMWRVTYITGLRTAQSWNIFSSDALYGHQQRQWQTSYDSFTLSRETWSRLKQPDILAPAVYLGLHTVVSHCFKGSCVETIQITKCYKHQLKDWDKRQTQYSEGDFLILRF